MMPINKTGMKNTAIPIDEKNISNILLTVS
jgi:hypothetical protein